VIDPVECLFRAGLLYRCPKAAKDIRGPHLVSPPVKLFEIHYDLAELFVFNAERPPDKRDDTAIRAVVQQQVDAMPAYKSTGPCHKSRSLDRMLVFHRDHRNAIFVFDHVNLLTESSYSLIYVRSISGALANDYVEIEG
jgi:hypothetical protein